MGHSKTHAGKLLTRNSRLEVLRTFGFVIPDKYNI